MDLFGLQAPLALRVEQYQRLMTSGHHPGTGLWIPAYLRLIPTSVP